MYNFHFSTFESSELGSVEFEVVVVITFDGPGTTLGVGGAFVVLDSGQH